MLYPVEFEAGENETTARTEVENNVVAVTKNKAAFKSPDQLSDELITLSLLPQSRWRHLTSLELIKVKLSNHSLYKFIFVLLENWIVRVNLLVIHVGQP